MDKLFGECSAGPHDVEVCVKFRNGKSKKVKVNWETIKGYYDYSIDPKYCVADGYLKILYDTFFEEVKLEEHENPNSNPTS